jgi:hypothetical protein
MNFGTLVGHWAYGRNTKAIRPAITGLFSTSGVRRSSVAGLIKIARSLGSLPPSIRDMLNSEPFPQTTPSRVDYR